MAGNESSLPSIPPSLYPAVSLSRLPSTPLSFHLIIPSSLLPLPTYGPSLPHSSVLRSLHPVNPPSRSHILTQQHHRSGHNLSQKMRISEICYPFHFLYKLRLQLFRYNEPPQGNGGLRRLVSCYADLRNQDGVGVRRKTHEGGTKHPQHQRPRHEGGK